MNQPTPAWGMLAASALGVLAIAIGGCGDDDESTTEAASTTSTAAASIDQALLDQAVADYDAYVEQETQRASSTRPRPSWRRSRPGTSRRPRSSTPPPACTSSGSSRSPARSATSIPDIDGREGDIPKAGVGWLSPDREGPVDRRDDRRARRDDKELRNDVANLNDIAIKADSAPVEIAQGSVDLMAEVSSSKITGEEERYSHTDLWDFEANVEGAEAGFEALEPALERVDPELVDEIDGAVRRHVRAARRATARATASSSTTRCRRSRPRSSPSRWTRSPSRSRRYLPRSGDGRLGSERRAAARVHPPRPAQDGRRRRRRGRPRRRRLRRRPRGRRGLGRRGHRHGPVLG